ncbi:MAG: hypothetical protein HYZ01_04340 [Ignavibacteriales bacterium]|nr:hypothetical protein [Ignavibacteriales bacterium]
MLKNPFLFFLTLCLLPALPVQAQISEDEAIQYVKRLSPSALDSTLPEGHFSEWLVSIIGDSATVQWELNDCGEQTGDPAIDTLRDIPACVGVYVTFPDNRKVGIMIAVGTSNKGLAGPPVVYDLYLESKGTFLGVKRLRDLPAALKRSLR